MVFLLHFHCHRYQPSWNGWDSPGILGFVPMMFQLGRNKYNVPDSATLNLVSIALFPTFRSTNVLEVLYLEERVNAQHAGSQVG